MSHEIPPRRRVCFVTGTRAEFGLMLPVLRAVRDHPRLELQIIVTGMHLSRAHGHTVDAIRSGGWNVDATVPWRGDLATATGLATSGIARRLKRLHSDVVLVCGDRVEAFAGAVAGHLSRLAVAHVHGGDRALGQVDDSLRHAITKLSHVHFPATATSAKRIQNMGEDADRIHLVGSPGVDGIRSAAASVGEIRREFPSFQRRRYALVLIHPVDADADVECRRASGILRELLDTDVGRVIAIYPNNDPGSKGIIRAIDEQECAGKIVVRKSLSRELFLGLLRDAAFLIGNSSSGIIEAGSFTTPVIDIGDRQRGRECGGEVIHAQDRAPAIRSALRRVWNDGHPLRTSGKNVYGGDGVGPKVANVLAQLRIDQTLLHKIISY